MQDYLDSKLIHRLLRPIERPGVIDTGMGWEIVGRSQQFTNRLPLLSHLTQRWHRQIGFQGDEIPIVYAKPQPQETPTTRSSIASELSHSPSSQRTVVQAKFVASAPQKIANLSPSTSNQSPINGEGVKSAVPVVSPNRKSSQPTNSVGWVESSKPNPNNQPTNSVGWVESSKPNPTSVLNFPIAEPNLQSLNANGTRTNPMMETFPSSQRTIVQAKFAPGSDRGLLPSNPTPIVTSLPTEKPPVEQKLNLNLPNLSLKTKATDRDRQPEELFSETSQNPIPIVQARSQPASDRPISPAEKLPYIVESIGEAIAFGTSNALPNLSRKTIQNPQSQIPNPIGWSGLETPLVFSNPRINTESVQAELKVPNPGITGISRTEPTTQTTGLSKQVSANIQDLQSEKKSNIQQPNVPDKSNIQNPIDLEALTDKVERKLMQRLIIESERRGRTR